MTKTTQEKKETKKQPFRPKLHTRALIVGYRRSLRKQYRHTSVLRIEGVKERKAADFYLGKRVAYVYKSAKNGHAKHGVLGGRRVIWGKIIKAHGNSGAVKAKFNPQLPPTTIGKRARVFLYPSHI